MIIYSHFSLALICGEGWLFACCSVENWPLVFAQKHVSNDAPTLLIYAHCDVMPAESLDLWKSHPYEPEIRDGHIWVRGADDDKGQAMIQVIAFAYVVKNGLLKHNVKFIFEGEEEIEMCIRDSYLSDG